MKILEPFFMHYFDVFILHEKLKLHKRCHFLLKYEQQ